MASNAIGQGEIPQPAPYQVRAELLGRCLAAIRGLVAYVRAKEARHAAVRGLARAGWDTIVDLYERHALHFDRARSRSLQEKVWLDRFLNHVRPSGVVLDIGCGTAEPIARYVLEAGFGVVGVDSSPSMIEMCHARFPSCEWIVGDMRQLGLGRRFDALLAWDSFFHLHMDDQRAMFPRFAAHAGPGAPLMFTSGTSQGEAIGSCGGEPLYHASLDPVEYERLLLANGFAVLSYCANDPECGEHTVWLAQYQGNSQPNAG